MAGRRRDGDEDRRTGGDRRQPLHSAAGDTGSNPADRMAAAALRRRGRPPAHEHPCLRGGNTDTPHRGRYLHRQRQAEPAHSRVEQFAGSVPRRPGRRGISARVDRYRAVHSPARGPCRVEHDAGRGQMGADIPARPLPDGPRRIRTLVAPARPRGHHRGIRRFSAAGLRRRAGRSGGNRCAVERRDQPDTDGGSHAGSCQRAHPLARRGGADHRRLHAPPLPDRAPRVGVHRGQRSGTGTAHARANVRAIGGNARAGDRHAFRRCDGRADCARWR